MSNIRGEDIAAQDAKQIVAVHDTTTNPFIVPSIGGRIGDPFPSYWDGVWHVYTLRQDLSYTSILKPLPPGNSLT